MRVPLGLALEQLSRLRELDGGFAFVNSSPLRAYFGEDCRAATKLLHSFVGDAVRLT